MRVAVVTNFIYPETLGGTELYCYQLVNALKNNGHEVFWFVPNFSESVTDSTFTDTGVEVVRFASLQPGVSTSEAAFVASSFVNEMKERKIAVAHFNEFGGFEGISGTMLRPTKAAGIITIVTLHLPHYLCHTGTLRYAGAEVCDGQVIPNRCGSCIMFTNATSFENLNMRMAQLARKSFDFINKHQLPVPAKLKVIMGRFTNRLPFIEALKNDTDAIVTLTQWFKRVLMVNGISEEKIKYIPQATPDDIFVENDGSEKRNGFVFIGRVNQEKGIQLLLDAAIKLQKKQPAIFIDIYGPVPVNNQFSDDFLKQLEKFSNIKYKTLLPPSEVMRVMLLYKAVILPSLFTEMAPLIIMEANKLKVPMIVSDVPGSAELVRQYDSGVIFKYNSSDGLVDAILKIENGTSGSFEFKQPFENNFDHIARKYVEIYASVDKSVVTT